MTEEIAFTELPKKDIPDKGDVKDEKMGDEILHKIIKEKKEDEIRKETGTELPKKGSFTKDVPQLAFRFVADIIPCPKFALSDEEATVFAQHLNVLIPLEGKLLSLVVIIMIIANKCYQCLDALKLKFGQKRQEMGNEEPGIPKKEEHPAPTNVVGEV